MVDVDRIVQFSPLVRDMSTALDRVHGFLGAFPSRRNHLGPTGVDLAIIPFGDETFMELVCPFAPTSAGARLLDRTGEGWFMLNVDLSDRQPVAEIDREIRASGARVVSGGVHGDGNAGSWHMHPADCAAVLLALYVRDDRPDHRDWAGPTWMHFVETNTRVVDRILGVSLATRDIAETAKRYEAFGFHFTREFEDAGDHVLQASPAGGTFLQLRAPLAAGTPLADWLDQRGQGLYHFAWGVRDLDIVRERLAGAGGAILREAEHEGRPATWAEAKSVLGMPLEFRLL